MALNDQQTNQLIANNINSFNERISIAQLSIVTLNVNLSMATEPEVRTGLAQQILAHQSDIDVLTAAIAELNKIGKTNSAARAAEAAVAGTTEARAVMESFVPEVMPVGKTDVVG